MLSLQEADADLWLFSTVKYISFYSVKVVHGGDISETFLLFKSIKTNTCWPNQLLASKAAKAVYSHLRIILITSHSSIITNKSSRSVSSKMSAAALSPAKWPTRESQRCLLCWILHKTSILEWFQRKSWVAFWGGQWISSLRGNTTVLTNVLLLSAVRTSSLSWYSAISDIQTPSYFLLHFLSSRY